MFCPKCGIENPDNGKFCRSCGTELGNVQAVLTGKSPIVPYTVDPRKRGVSWEFAITKTFTGVAFLVVSLILALTGKFGAENWWFWLLIPGFGSLSSGIAQIYQLRKIEKIEAGFSQPQISNSAQQKNILPPAQTDYTMPPKQSIYDTEDLVIQPSVTENTTRHLKINEEL
ncbi:MAG: zinc-ribbon domain-containing protein [Acidobacteriota bacterium]